MRNRLHVVTRRDNWQLILELRPREIWVGLRWVQLSSLGWEIDPKLPVRQTKDGTYYQVTNKEWWLQPLPCVTIHLRWWLPRG